MTMKTSDVQEETRIMIPTLPTSVAQTQIPASRKTDVFPGRNLPGTATLVTAIAVNVRALKNPFSIKFGCCSFLGKKATMENGNAMMVAANFSVSLKLILICTSDGDLHTKNCVM